MRIYGYERTPEEVRRFVTDYKAKIDADANGRYPAIREMVPVGRVLDFGCGWGAFSKMLAERGNDVVGIDLDDNEVDICRHVWGDTDRLSFKRAAISELEDATFDCVVSNEVIEHVHNPGTYLHQINRVLSPDGVLVISLPNVMTPRLMLPSLSFRLGGFLRQVSEQTRREYRKGGDHINAWDAPHFVRLVTTVGFVLLDHRPLEGIALPRSRFWPAYVRFPPLRNLSYSMGFAFEKVERSAIGAYD